MSLRLILVVVTDLVDTQKTDVLIVYFIHTVKVCTYVIDVRYVKIKKMILSNNRKSMYLDCSKLDKFK